MSWFYYNGIWYLFGEEEESLAEVGVEYVDGYKSYYWLDCKAHFGLGDYDTLEEAQTAAITCLTQ